MLLYELLGPCCKPYCMWFLLQVSYGQRFVALLNPLWLSQLHMCEDTQAWTATKYSITALITDNVTVIIIGCWTLLLHLLSLDGSRRKSTQNLALLEVLLLYIVLINTQIIQVSFCSNKIRIDKDLVSMYALHTRFRQRRCKLYKIYLYFFFPYGS